MLYICNKWIDGIRAPLIKGIPTALSTFSNRWNHLNVGIMQQEIWKNVPGFENRYEVSNYGRVRLIKNGKIVYRKPITMRDGYLNVCLYDYGHKKGKTILIHRLVAMAFIPNPQGLPEINHKDENKQNNHVDNLEWCNRAYNVNYGNCLNKIHKKICKPVLCYDLLGNFIGEYESVREAAQKLNAEESAISRCARGIYKFHKNFVFKYKGI